MFMKHGLLMKMKFGRLLVYWIRLILSHLKLERYVRVEKLRAGFFVNYRHSCRLLLLSCCIIADLFSIFWSCFVGSALNRIHLIRLVQLHVAILFVIHVGQVCIYFMVLWFKLFLNASSLNSDSFRLTSNTMLFVASLIHEKYFFLGGVWICMMELIIWLLGLEDTIICF